MREGSGPCAAQAGGGGVPRAETRTGDPEPQCRPPSASCPGDGGGDAGGGGRFRSRTGHPAPKFQNLLGFCVRSLEGRGLRAASADPGSIPSTPGRGRAGSGPAASHCVRPGWGSSRPAAPGPGSRSRRPGSRPRAARREPDLRSPAVRLSVRPGSPSVSPQPLRQTPGSTTSPLMSQALGAGRPALVSPRAGSVPPRASTAPDPRTPGLRANPQGRERTPPKGSPDPAVPGGSTPESPQSRRREPRATREGYLEEGAE